MYVSRLQSRQLLGTLTLLSQSTTKACWSIGTAQFTAACMHDCYAMSCLCRSHKLVEEYPNQALSWYAVGCYYMCTKQYEQARRFFGKATSLDRNSAPSWLGFGHAFAAQVSLVSETSNMPWHAALPVQAQYAHYSSCRRQLRAAALQGIICTVCAEMFERSCGQLLDVVMQLPLPLAQHMPS